MARPDLVKKVMNLDEARFKFDLSKTGKLWANGVHTNELYELMLLARAVDCINPMKEVPSTRQEGKFIIAADLEHGGFLKIKPYYTQEVQDAIKKKQHPTVPDAQGEDGGRQ
jgi:hypothetical protein